MRRRTVKAHSFPSALAEALAAPNFETPPSALELHYREITKRCAEHLDSVAADVLAAARADERERCAKVVDDHYDTGMAAEAIRRLT